MKETAIGSAKSVSTKCRLLELPAELRIRIYELALSSVEVLDILEDDEDEYEGRSIATQPALTRTNHQIRVECLPVFYEVNSFRLHLTIHGNARVCLRHGKIPVQHLRDLKIRVYHLQSDTWATLSMVYRKKADTFTVAVEQINTFDSFSDYCLQKKRMRNHLLELLAGRGPASLNTEDYIGFLEALREADFGG